MAEVRARLATEGSAAPSPYLSTAAYKLTNNLPRFFGLVAANTFLARCVASKDVHACARVPASSRFLSFV